MECIDSSSTYSKTAYAANTLEGDTGSDSVPIDKDSFECTFFRQPKRQLLNGLPLSSDTYADSDSDVDALYTSEQSLPKLLRDSNQSVIDEKSFKSNSHFDKLKVRFGTPVCIDSDSKKRWMKGRNERGPANLQRLMKRSICLKKNYSENKKLYEKFNAELVVCKNLDSELTQPFPEKYFRPVNASEGGRNTVQDRIIRNKHLLKTIEEMIQTINEAKVVVESRKRIKPSIKIAKTNIANEGKNKQQRKRPKKKLNNSEETPMQKSFFENPKLEKDLNESMQKAIKKYRTCWKWKEHDFFRNKKSVC